MIVGTLDMEYIEVIILGRSFEVSVFEEMGCAGLYSQNRGVTYRNFNKQAALQCVK